MSIRKKLKLTKWMIAGVITAGIAGYIAYKAMRPAAAAYKNVKARIGDITTYYSFSGNIASKNRYTILSDRIIQIEKIHVNEGETVEEETILAVTTTGEEIKSKMKGEVVNLRVQAGDLLPAGSKLMDIVDYENLEVVFKVDEYDISALELGKEAMVKINALDKEIHGKIREVSKDGQIMNGVTFYIASIDIDPDEKIRIGMSAEVRLVSGKAERVVVLPMNVIQFDEQNHPYILKQDAKKSVVRADITTGIYDGTTVEIRNGVRSGENVLYRKSTSFGEILFPERGKKARVYMGGGNE